MDSWLKASIQIFVIVHHQGAENAEKNTYKGKNPHNFSVYSLRASAILACSAVI